VVEVLNRLGMLVWDDRHWDIAVVLGFGSGLHSKELVENQGRGDGTQNN
jgi:hypothetical protein